MYWGTFVDRLLNLDFRITSQYFYVATVDSCSLEEFWKLTDLIRLGNCSAVGWTVSCSYVEEASEIVKTDFAGWILIFYFWLARMV